MGFTAQTWQDILSGLGWRDHLFVHSKAARQEAPFTVSVWYGQGPGNLVLRPRKTWTSIGNPQKPIGKDPKVMEASRQKFASFHRYWRGRGIYYGFMKKAGKKLNRHNYFILKLVLCQPFCDHPCLQCWKHNFRKQLHQFRNKHSPILS